MAPCPPGCTPYLGKAALKDMLTVQRLVWLPTEGATAKPPHPHWAHCALRRQVEGP